MTTQTRRLTDQALLLPARERADMVDELLLSLQAQPEQEVDDAWRAEVEMRLDQMLNGEVEPIDGEQAVADLRARYGR